MMVEGEETGCLTVLEKKGLHQTTEILENYGIDSDSEMTSTCLSFDEPTNR